MTGTLKAAAAAVLAATASLASAAPVGNIGDMARDASDVIHVHAFHEHCARDRYGWHRHNQWGDRRPCRRWRGVGPRPDLCVRVGPAWFCEYR